MIDVHQAIREAKTYVSNVFQDEPIQDLGLEETEFDSQSQTWKITLGLRRPWDERPAPILGGFGGPRPRAYKLVTLGSDGNVLSMKDR